MHNRPRKIQKVVRFSSRGFPIFIILLLEVRLTGLMFRSGILMQIGHFMLSVMCFFCLLAFILFLTFFLSSMGVAGFHLISNWLFMV